ncbi:MAG: ABC transporter permease [Carboxydocellales bacterium]
MSSLPKLHLTAELFEPVQSQAGTDEVIIRPVTTYWQDAWRRLKQNKMAIIGLTTIGCLIIMAVVGPYMSKYTYYQQDLTMANQPPSTTYWLGTDALGRDLYTRLWYGARISLLVGVVTSLISLVVGVLYGGIAGFAGGKVDEIMMRIVEILWAVPFLLYVILLMVVLGPGLKTIFIALGAVFWMGMARIVRGEMLSLKEREFVLAARVLGASSWRILWRHLIPNAIGPIIIQMTLAIPEAIFIEAFLSFLGLGVSVPMASWGVLASTGMEGIRSYPWQIFFPAALITITMLAFNFLGDGLREALDPRMG